LNSDPDHLKIKKRLTGRCCKMRTLEEKKVWDTKHLSRRSLLVSYYNDLQKG
jgi:hypothetical protein